ncbi:MAG: hypothetical protein WBF32_04540 [Candidatus Aminicenantaceae bacterium]
MKNLIIFLSALVILSITPSIFLFSQTNLVDLNAEYDLALFDNPGDTSHYRLRTVYYHGNALGITYSREELIATFKREVKKIEKGVHLVEYTWNAAKIGKAKGLVENITEWKTLPYAEGFSYAINFAAPNFPGGVDFSPLPSTLEGMKFMVNVLDAHAQFELLRTESAGGISRIRKAGDRISNPGAWQGGGWDFNTFIQGSDFANGEYETLFTGFSMVDGKVCAVLEYINSESLIKNKTQVTPKMSIEQESTSNFWGHVFIDLATRKLLKGDLYEYVITHAKMPGQKEAIKLFERRLIEIQSLNEE